MSPSPLTVNGSYNALQMLHFAAIATFILLYFISSGICPLPRIFLV